MPISGGPDRLNVFIANRQPLALELLEYLFDINRVPNDDRVGDQVQAAYLMAQCLIFLTSQLALIRKKQMRTCEFRKSQHGGYGAPPLC